MTQTDCAAQSKTPIAPPAVATREELLHLLAEAAEFEHNLLCCYLYAAFSLKRNGEGWSETEKAAVGRWRENIMAVAIEEMTHLALVANITVALGARPHFNRPNLPVAPRYHPAGMVVELAPFNMDTLDHFIFLERSPEVNTRDGESFRCDTGYVRGDQAGVALMPAAVDYTTIAEFYESIRQVLESISAKVGEKALFMGGKDLQLTPEVARLPGLSEVTDLASALGALDTIVTQGEGSSSETEDSHFARFVAIKEEYERLRQANAGFEPAWNAARNPVMRAPVATEQRVHINDPQAAAVVDLANALYNHMLRLLAQAYGRADPQLQTRKTLVGAAIDVMSAVRTVAEYLATLPASRSIPGVHAGMTFATLRATEPLCEISGELGLLATRLTELAQGLRLAAAGASGFEPVAARLDKVASQLRA